MITIGSWLRNHQVGTYRRSVNLTNKANLCTPLAMERMPCVKAMSNWAELIRTILLNLEVELHVDEYAAVDYQRCPETRQEANVREKTQPEITGGETLSTP